METEGDFSLIIEGCLETCPYCSALHICIAMFACASPGDYLFEQSGWTSYSAQVQAMINGQIH
jgi:hypothetical protein